MTDNSVEVLLQALNRIAGLALQMCDVAKAAVDEVDEVEARMDREAAERKVRDGR